MAEREGGASTAERGPQRCRRRFHRRRITHGVRDGAEVATEGEAAAIKSIDGVRCRAQKRRYEFPIGKEHGAKRSAHPLLD